MDSLSNAGAGRADPLPEPAGEGAEGRKKHKPAGKAGVLLRMLDDRIDSFQARRKENRARSFNLKIAGTIFSALTTVLLGLQLTDPILEYLYKSTALALSAMVTVLTTWEAFFDHKGLWVKYTRARAQLLAVKAELEYMLADPGVPPQDASVDALFLKYQQILEETNASWLQLRSDEGRKH